MADREILNLHALKENSLGIKFEAQRFCRSGVKQTRFENLKEKGKWIFFIRVAL